MVQQLKLHPTFATTNIYSITPTTQPPYVWITMLSEGADTRGVTGATIFANPSYVVRYVAEGLSRRAFNVQVKAIYQALHRKRGSVPEGEIRSCLRVAPFYLAESNDGRTIQHVGHQFRFIVQ